jgi:hypothetical protein
LHNSLPIFYEPEDQNSDNTTTATTKDTTDTTNADTTTTDTTTTTSEINLTKNQRVVKVYDKSKAEVAEDEIVCICPLCKSSPLILRLKDTSLYIACSGFPQCRNITRLPPFVKKVITTDEACKTCSDSYNTTFNKVKLVFAKEHIVGQMKIYLPEDDGTAGTFCFTFRLKKGACSWELNKLYSLASKQGTLLKKKLNAKE